MKLYLVQHAEAKSEEEDPQRPLTERGVTEINKVAAFIQQPHSIHVKCIYHSGKARAKETAGILADYLAPSDGILQTDGLKPLDDPDTWINRLADINDDIMIVGHLPYMRQLAALLICCDELTNPVSFQMGGVVALKRDESGTWSINWMVTPHLLS